MSTKNPTEPASAKPEPNPQIVELLAELRRTNDLLAEQVKQSKNWKREFGISMLRGLGAVIGATLLVSVILFALQPLRKIERLEPMLDKVIHELEKRPTTR